MNVIVGRRGVEIKEYPCSWLKQTSWLLLFFFFSLEIKLLCLHVGSGVKVEGSSLSALWDQAGIFIDLKRGEEKPR